MSITPEKITRIKQLAADAELAWYRDIDEYCGTGMEVENSTKNKDEFFALLNELIETVEKTNVPAM